MRQYAQESAADRLDNTAFCVVAGQALTGSRELRLPEGVFEEGGGVLEKIVVDEEFQVAIGGVGGFAKLGYADDGSAVL